MGLRALWYDAPRRIHTHTAKSSEPLVRGGRWGMAYDLCNAIVSRHSRAREYIERMYVVYIEGRLYINGT